MELNRSFEVEFLLPLLFFFLYILLMISTCDGRAVLCHAEEREALLQFKDGFSKAKMISSWGGEDCCSWKGIGCDNRTGHVVKLKLRGTIHWDPGYHFAHDSPFLRGKIGPSLALLKYLRRLDLSGNNFEGSPIPHFLGSIERLTYLNLSLANFSGVVPPHLGNLSSLQILDLSYVYKVETNGEWLSQLRQLRYLDLSYIDLTRENNLFEVLNMLPFLETLHLYNWPNNFTQSSLRAVNFTRLSEFWIDGDRFLNPCWLFNVTSLENLYIYFNYLGFDDCRNDLFAQLCNLKSLRLLGGSAIIKRDLNQFFMECNQRLALVSLDLSYNSFIGQLPSWLGEYKRLETLDMSGNNLSGSVPESIGAIASLKTLSLSGNNLAGFIPQSIGRLQSLEHLDISGNNLMGSIPQSIGRLQSLEYLDFSSNNLSGPLHSSLGKLKSLQYLDLSGNYLQGNLTEEHFTHLSNLTTLYLSSNSFRVTLSPHWVPPFNLIRLELRSCNVGTYFPSWLRTQNNLQALDLSDSNISDVIPQWLWNFSSHIWYIDLSKNKLKGVVPAATYSSRMSDIILYSNLLEGSLSSFPPFIRYYYQETYFLGQ